MANCPIVAVIMYALTVAIRCQNESDSLTLTSMYTEATTLNYVENSSDAINFFQTAEVNIESQFPNGSYCRLAYTCHSAANAEASSVVLGCSCHDYCAMYGDCCLDKISIVPHTEPQNLSRGSYICPTSYLFLHPVYMISACPASYKDQSVAGNCWNFTDFSTPSMDIRWTPVTDIVTGITFRNVYCAICWGKTWRSVASWLWKLTCPPNQVHFTEGHNDSTSSASDNGPFGADSAADYVRNACTLTFEPPLLNVSLHFCNKNAIADCGLNSNSADLDRTLLSGCLNGTAAYVYDEFGSVYWNAECARCGYWPVEPKLSCQPRGIGGGFGGISLGLSIILTPESGDCVAAAGSLSSSNGWTPDALCLGLHSCQSQGVGMTAGCQRRLFSPCSGPEFSGNAIGSSCTASASETLSICTFVDSEPSTDAVAKARSTVWLNTSADGSALLAVTLIDNTTLCYRCTTERYENYTIVNRSIVINSLTDRPRQSFDYPMYVVKEGIATVCSSLLPWHIGSTAQADDGCSAVPDWVSALFLCFSEVAIVVFFVAFSRVKALRRFPGEMVLNESAAFFLAFLLFLVRPLLGSSKAACTAIAVLIHYCLLAAFAWTALYSTEIASALSFRVSAGVSKRRRAIHYGLAWISPLVCVAIGLSADDRALEFRPQYGPPQCFIGSRLGNLTLFMAPLCIFLTIDIIVYIFMIVKLVVIARQTKAVRSSHHEKFWLSLKLVLSMGLLWIFAVLASFTQSAALYCVFSLVNALQGVFVFLVYVCKRDILIVLGRKSKTSTTTTASTQLSSRTISTTSTVSPS